MLIIDKVRDVWLDSRRPPLRPLDVRLVKAHHHAEASRRFYHEL